MPETTQFQIDRQSDGQKVVRAIGGRHLTAAEKDIAASLTTYFNQQRWEERLTHVHTHKPGSDDEAR